MGVFVFPGCFLFFWQWIHLAFGKKEFQQSPVPPSTRKRPSGRSPLKTQERSSGILIPLPLSVVSGIVHLDLKACVWPCPQNTSSFVDSRPLPKEGSRWLLVCRRAQSHPTLYDPLHCSPPGSSVHGIPQAGSWSGLPFPSPGDLPDPGIFLTQGSNPCLLKSPALQADSSPLCHLGSPNDHLVNE